MYYIKSYVLPIIMLISTAQVYTSMKDDINNTSMVDDINNTLIKDDINNTLAKNDFNNIGFDQSIIDGFVDNMDCD